MDNEKEIAERLLGEKVLKISAHDGGGNNNIFFVGTDTAEFALKLYPKTDECTRDRFHNEVSALQFFAHFYATNEQKPLVPRFVAADKSSQSAIMEWIKGEQPTPNAHNISLLNDFINQLKMISNDPETKFSSHATEACLSGQELQNQLEKRLHDLIDPTIIHSPRDFLLNDVKVLQDQYLHKAKSLIAGNWAKDIDSSYHILSPSDLGFHNAIQRPNGQISFLDFEYFGWDDPVKLICDTCWHPGMSLSTNYIKTLVKNSKRSFENDPTFNQRMIAYYPLFGLRWIYIILAIFRPDKWLRSQKAGCVDSWDNMRSLQLQKAQNIFQRIEKESKMVGFLFNE